MQDLNSNKLQKRVDEVVSFSRLFLSLGEHRQLFIKKDETQKSLKK